WPTITPCPWTWKRATRRPAESCASLDARHRSVKGISRSVGSPCRLAAAAGGADGGGEDRVELRVTDDRLVERLGVVVLGPGLRGRGCLDRQVGRDALLAVGAVAGGVELGGGELQPGGGRAEGEDALHRALAIRAFADHRGAAVVLQGAGEDL